MELIYPKEGVSAQADTPSFSTIILIYKIRIADRVGNVGVSAPTADRQTQAAPVLESGIAT